jgi:hypothetical protein
VASLKSVFSKSIRKAEQAATAGYTAKLRSHVKDYGWPDHLVNAISISHDGSNHKITYPKHLENQILTLEYGTQDTPASPAFRTFMMGGN